MIIGRSLTPLNSSRTLRAVRRREMVRCSDDNSRRKVQNVRAGSSARFVGVFTRHNEFETDRMAEERQSWEPPTRTPMPGLSRWIKD
jgi:hypothetical protein